MAGFTPHQNFVHHSYGCSTEGIKLETLLEHSPDAVIIRGTDRKITYWNKGAEQWLGYSREEALGKTAIELGIISFSTEEIEHLDLSLASTGYWQSEKDFFHKDGNQHRGFVTANYIGTGDHKIGAVIFIVKDFTKHWKRSEALKKVNISFKDRLKEKIRQIRANDIRFRALTENSQEALALLDAKGYIFYRSPAATRITGWTDEDAALPDFFRRVVLEEDYPQFQSFMQQALAHPDLAVPVHYRIRHKQGGIRFIEGTFMNMLGTDARALVLDTYDVTEKIEGSKELEQKTQQLTEREKQLELYIRHSPAAVAMFDMDMRYLVASNRWISDYGLAGTTVAGRSHYELFPELPAACKVVHQDCLRGAVVKKEEDQMIRADGTVSWLRWEVRPWHHADERIGGIIIFSEDITERKNTEIIIRKNEEKLRTVLDRISDGFIALDNNWNFEYVNTLAEQIVGKTSASLQGKNIWLEFPELVDSPFYYAYHDSLSTQKHTYLEEYSAHAGTWLRVNIYPSPTGLSIYFSDISKEKEAEARAKKSDTLRKTIMKSALDAIICSDDKGIITSCNRQAELMFGYKAQKWRGKPVSDLIIPERLRARHNEGIKRFNEGHTGKFLKRLTETTAINSEGKEFPIELFITPIQEDDHVTFCAFIRDISERKKSEEVILRSQFLMNQAQQIAHLGHWEIDVQTRHSQWSEEAYRIYGMEPGDLNISLEEWLDFVHPEDRERVSMEIENGKKGWTGSSFHHRIIRPDGSVRHIYSESRYILGQKGEPVSFYGITHDVTEHHILQSELREQQRKEQLKLVAAALEAREKERNAIGIELHDNVNQILVGTMLTLSTIKTNGKTSGIISSAIENLQLAISENRKISHELVSPDFGDKPLTAEINRITRSMLISVGIKASVDLSGFDESLLPPQLKLTLYRIVQEQCTNIVKYAGASNVSIRINHIKQVLSMSVSDDGKGVDPGQHTEGIGLRNIRSRLSVHEGTVKIRTSPGRGFALDISIPLPWYAHELI